LFNIITVVFDGPAPPFILVIFTYYTEEEIPLLG